MATPNKQRVMAEPIVFELADSKRKGTRTSRSNWADAAERGLYRASRTTIDATDKGLHRYNKARRVSARRERDGTMIDLLPNMARGVAGGARRIVLIPLDLMNVAPVRDMTRRSVREMTRILDRS